MKTGEKEGGREGGEGRREGDLTQETANYGSFFGYSLDMKIPVAKSFGYYQLAHNLYHVDVLCPQAC